MRHPGRPSAAGFTLIEVIAAFLIFAFLASFAGWVMSASADQSLASEEARILRMLAERKLGEVAVFERHYDVADSGTFDDLPDELREAYGEWEWETEIRDVTVFGTQTDANADYLWDAPDAGETAETAAAGGAGSQGAQKKGDTQMLRELVLRVKAPAAEGEGEMIEVVTYLPQVPQKTAGGAGGAK